VVCASPFPPWFQQTFKAAEAGPLALGVAASIRTAMHTVLFDDMGDVWDAKSRSLAEVLGASLSADELTKYVVRNLGFIAAAENDGSVSLRLRPAVVSGTALGALIYWLHDRPVARVLLSFLEGDWMHELVASRDEAIRRLLTRVAPRTEGREGDFLKQQLPLHVLQANTPLRALLDAWADCRGRYDRERLHSVIQQALNGRFVLFEALPGSSSVYVKEVGKGLGQSGNYWLSRTKGLRVEDQPDYAYGKWVAQVYREVLDTRNPALDNVDAVVNFPQQPRKCYRYRRLVLPFEQVGNSTLVLSATVIDPHISLRVQPSQEAS
jgi:hypothetical protein